jgi:endonuclease/exonuclease/phosphatase (EEP) superfamily protein YafD
VLRKKRRATGAAECGLGVLLGLLGLILSRAGHLWIGFDVFSQFTLHFAILTAAFAAGLLLPRAKLLVALLLVLGGVVAIGVWPHVASRSPHPLAPQAAGERALRVASFNTLWVNEDADRVLAEIERLDADIVTLLEVSPAKRRILAALKQRYPYQADCFAVDYCRLVVLSKVPIIDSEARGRWDGPPFILARLGPEAGGLSVMAVHTIRFPHSRAQFRQVSVLARLIEKQQGHKLVMGDFNATPFSRILAVIEAGANLRRITFLPSWPATAGLPQIAIDHIFLSSGLRLLEAARIGEAAGSDHYPVTARIAVPLSP